MLVTVVMVTSLMVTLGLASYTFVRGQQKQSGDERVRESSFTLDEGALNAQVFRLSRSWPGTVDKAYPASCTQASGDARCPDAAGLARSYAGADFAGGTWTTKVRDNGSSPSFFNNGILASQPTWDANGDGRIWVWSQALLHGQKRTLVGLAQVTKTQEEFPRSVVVAGRFETTNNGNKVIVDTRGSAAAPSPVTLRCGGFGAGCASFRRGQVSPELISYGYTGGSALTPEGLERMRDRAIANGTYYENGCPLDPTGAVVFVERGDCAYNSKSGTVIYNSAASPGVFIVANGTFYIDGTVTFYGIVYAANQQQSTGNVVEIAGKAVVNGAVAIDGGGELLAGDTGDAGPKDGNLYYNANVFKTFESYSAAKIVQNSWRELPS